MTGTRSPRAGAMLAEGYAGVVLDVDGVLVRGDQALPGAADTVTALAEAGIGVAFVTNNASRTPEQVAAALSGVGIPAEPDAVVTSALAAAELLEPGTGCLVIGMDGLRSALRARGCVELDDPWQADAVVVGLDRSLVWDDLRRATLALGRGARFVGTNADASIPVEEGLWPGNGAILAALTAASGRRPEIAGKPEAALFEVVLRRLPAGPILMVGDRHETDIAGAAALGWDTALVLTGVTSADAVGALDPPPTYVLGGVAELVRPA